MSKHLELIKELESEINWSDDNELWHLVYESQKKSLKKRGFDTADAIEIAAINANRFINILKS